MSLCECASLCDCECEHLTVSAKNLNTKSVDPIRCAHPTVRDLEKARAGHPVLYRPAVIRSLRVVDRLPCTVQKKNISQYSSGISSVFFRIIYLPNRLCLRTPLAVPTHFLSPLWCTGGGTPSARSLIVAICFKMTFTLKKEHYDL